MSPASRATVVILAWNAWEHTQRCLDSLQPTLGPEDQVVVVDNGSTDATRRGARRSTPGSRSCATTKIVGSPGAAIRELRWPAASVVVFLNNDTIVHGGWLDELLAPFADPEVGAVGPRSNSVSGHQLVR